MSQSTDKPEILVTGVGGSLANHVINRLKDAYTVIGVGFKAGDRYDDSITCYHIDFSKRGFKDVFRKHHFAGVIHLGRILLYEYSRFQRYAINVQGTQRIFDLCLKFGVSNVIVLSTYYVYGAHPYNPTLINEMYPLKASNFSAALADAVELENLSTIYMLKYPQLKLSVLRPCNIVGSNVRNSLSLMLQRKYAPYLAGFNPMMQFIHVEDLARAITTAFIEPKPGIYNVGMNDWVPYLTALETAGCKPFPLPSVPSSLPKSIVRLMNIREFPDYLLDYYKFPVILDNSLFQQTFNFQTKHDLKNIFEYYQDLIEMAD